jgi:hypothetical protein
MSFGAFLLFGSRNGVLANRRYRALIEAAAPQGRPQKRSAFVVNMRLSEEATETPPGAPSNVRG